VEEVEQVKKAPVKQPYDFFLVLDIEGTCEEGHTFDYPNEIIVSPWITTVLPCSNKQHAFTAVYRSGPSAFWAGKIRIKAFSKLSMNLGLSSNQLGSLN
jgi:hypothetical protein